MEETNCLDIISCITRKALWEVKNTIDCLPEDMWNRSYCHMPLWKHIYHMLHSLDRWFINPEAYAEPDFHIENLNNLDVETGGRLGRVDIERYFSAVEIKIADYLASLSNDGLLLRPEGCRWTRFALMLAQHRHLATHQGIIMGFIIAETGRWPCTLGLTREIPDGDYEKFM